MPKSAPSYFEPKPLTEKEKLQAALVTLSYRIPHGYQAAMPLHIDASIKTITDLFPKHTLPNHQELTTELEAWQTHIAEGQKHSDRCVSLMQDVFDDVRARPDNATPTTPSE